MGSGLKWKLVIFVMILQIRWFLGVATAGAGDEEFCDFALVMVLLFEYIGLSLLASLKLKEPSFHDVSVLL